MYDFHYQFLKSSVTMRPFQVQQTKRTASFIICGIIFYQVMIYMNFSALETGHCPPYELVLRFGILQEL